MDKNIVYKAIADDGSPTPGYLYNELAKLTHSSVDDCQKIQAILIKSLSKKSPLVKLKALKVIRHVSRAGRSDFQRGLQRNNAAIKECLQYRGEPHPLRGDEPNKLVRDGNLILNHIH